MTNSVILALNEIDEEYLFSYENRRPQKKVYLMNWKYWAVAAMLAIVVSIGLIIMPFNNKGNNEKLIRSSYESFESFINNASSHLKDETIILAGINLEEYETADYYSVQSESTGEYMELGPSIYILKTTKDGKTYEIAYQPMVMNSNDMPDKYKTENPYSDCFIINHIKISYRKLKTHIEGEFVGDSGYYKIICYSNQLSDFSDFMISLLN